MSCCCIVSVRSRDVSPSWLALCVQRSQTRRGDWKMRPASRQLHCIFMGAQSSFWEAPAAVIVQNDSQVNFCARQVEVVAPEN